MTAPFGRHEAMPPTKQGPHGRGPAGRHEGGTRDHPRVPFGVAGA
jgi:hypothetical protein